MMQTYERPRACGKSGLIILAIKREQDMHSNPSPEDRIQPGGHLIAMSEPALLRQLEPLASSPVTPP